MSKFALYANTIRYLKFEQLWHQVTKRLGCKCPLIRGYKPEFTQKDISLSPAVRELDYDADFIKRFSVSELMQNDVSLLHSTEHLELEGSWFFKNKSPLWNHNLHYFEYLFALSNQYEISGDRRYIDKIKEYIVSWIKQNPIGVKNSAWECYPIALRITNWVDLYSLLQKEFDEDKTFKNQFINSLFEQYDYLLNHLEKHLLANHYFEDLKALVIAACFFNDDKVMNVATDELIKQCHEQILDDGMQYERSPMYQKILLEDLIRVHVALKNHNKENESIKTFIKKMLDVSFSLEDGIERIPLFNDCGDNIAKSIKAIVESCKQYCDISPEYNNEFPNSGFYIYNYSNDKHIRIIIDAGQPSPKYSPGHSHCEAMSYEVFINGKPVIVNCGTFAYQTEMRSFFKSTQAHNTIKVANNEQSEIWSSFRMARRAKVKSVIKDEDSISATIKDYKNNTLRRKIEINSRQIRIMDETAMSNLTSFIHFNEFDGRKRISVIEGCPTLIKMKYAPEFGKIEDIDALEIDGNNKIEYTIDLS